MQEHPEHPVAARLVSEDGSDQTPHIAGRPAVADHPTVIHVINGHTLTGFEDHQRHGQAFQVSVAASLGHV